MQAALVAGSAAYGSYAQQKAAKEQLKLNERNANLLDDQARDALRRGDSEVRAVHRRTRSLIGRQRLQAAGQGIKVNSGVVNDLINESLVGGAADESLVRENAFREAWGYRTQATNTRISGGYNYRAGMNQSYGTLLGGIGDTARTYQQYDAPRVQGAR